MDVITTNLIDPVSNFLYSYVLIYLLVGAGIYFTVRTRGVQVRLARQMWRLIAGSRGNAAGGISSFQAFCVGLASRVGTGNIVGVAIALTLGGPGAIFWMWVVAFLGMATAFIESTLAQMYKVRDPDGSYRGGPAYYIQRGLGSRPFAILFASLLIFAFGFAFNMVQANTISDALAGHGVSTSWTAVGLVIFAAPVLFGGVRRVASVAGVLLPIMAGAYVLLALVVVALNVTEIPHVLAMILEGAFGLNQAAAGTAGGVVAALLNGAKRGLFSNEAGMGSAPNTAATATVSHPAKQGLIQSLGVFVDTMVVCSATAFMILVAGPTIYDPGTTTEAVGASLTTSAVSEALGTWTTPVMTVLIFTFAFSSVLGNYSYAEVNLTFLGIHGKALTALRTLVLAAIGAGALLSLDAVWALADVAMALMAIVNLVAISLLGKWAFGALRDYEGKLREGRGDERFVGAGNAGLPGDLPGDVWAPGATDAQSAAVPRPA